MCSKENIKKKNRKYFINKTQHNRIQCVMIPNSWNETKWWKKLKKESSHVFDNVYRMLICVVVVLVVVVLVVVVFAAVVNTVLVL